MAVAKKPSVVGNKTTESIIGAGASKLLNAVSSLQDVVKTLSNIDTIVEENTLKVVGLETTLAELEQQKKNTIAQNRIEIAQQFASDEQAFISDYLKNAGLVTIRPSEVDALKTELANTKSGIEDQVKREVNAQVGAIRAQFTNEAKMAALEHTTKEAQNLAKISQLEDRAAFLEEQVTSWKGALEAERTAGVERAKASSVGSINVTGASK